MKSNGSRSTGRRAHADAPLEDSSTLDHDRRVARTSSSRETPRFIQPMAARVKLKLDRQQEFVVGGYRPGPHGVDAVLVGYYERRDLRFAGKVRAGFTPHVRREVFAQLKSLEVDRCPFVDLPNSKASRWGAGVTPDQMKEMRWLNPKLVAQIRFVEWTSDGHLRHAAFLGIRDDKLPSDVRRESGGEVGKTDRQADAPSRGAKARRQPPDRLRRTPRG
jgi:ATP-dependent DNA ligase